MEKVTLTQQQDKYLNTILSLEAFIKDYKIKHAKMDAIDRLIILQHEKEVITNKIQFIESFTMDASAPFFI
jgi:hypothetical protein